MTQSSKPPAFSRFAIPTWAHRVPVSCGVWCSDNDSPAKDSKRRFTMTVIHTQDGALKPGNKPDWCQTPTAGYFRMSKEGGKHDCHYHEYNELYLVYSGKAKILNGGKNTTSSTATLSASGRATITTFSKSTAKRTSNCSGYMSRARRMDDWDICIGARSRQRRILFQRSQSHRTSPSEASAAAH